MSDFQNQDGSLKDKIELLPILEWWALPSSVRHEHVKACIMVKSVIDLEKSLGELTQTIKEVGDSSDKLWNRVFFLNIVLWAIAIIGAIYTVMTFYK